MVSRADGSLGMYYFLTLTFGKETRGYKEMHIKVICPLLKYLNLVASEYKLVAELGENGNFHYHALLKVKDKVKYCVMMNYWKTRHGFVKGVLVEPYKSIEIKSIDPMKLSLLNLNLYMNKQRLLHQMGYKYHMITNSTAKYHMNEIIEKRRTAKQRNEIVGILKYFK